MVQLRNDIKKFQAVGVQIVGISYDSVDVLKEFSDSEKIPFLLLSDEGSKTINDYDLNFKDGLPHPGTVLIGRDGTIRGKLFREGYASRHATDELIALAKEFE